MRTFTFILLFGILATILVLLPSTESQPPPPRAFFGYPNTAPRFKPAPPSVEVPAQAVQQRESPGVQSVQQSNQVITPVNNSKGSEEPHWTHKAWHHVRRFGEHVGQKFRNFFSG